MPFQKNVNVTLYKYEENNNKIRIFRTLMQMVYWQRRYRGITWLEDTW